MKKFCLFVFGIIFLLTSQAVAQNKVVVIPLDSGNCDCDEIPTVTSAGQVWMDRNLGALRVAQSMDDYQAYGWLYQWGRLADGHEIRSHTTATPSASNVPGHDDFITTNTSPYDWMSTQYNYLWDPDTGINNPCPAGFRVPTKAEWDTERASWNSGNASGAFASPLKLVMAGFRNYDDGMVDDAGSYGAYWSSSYNGSGADYLGIFDSGAVIPFGPRAYGFSVRCMKD